MPTDWFYAEGTQQRGPVTFEDLQARFARGELTADTQVWNATLPKWVPAHSVLELAAVLGGAAPAAEPGAVLGYHGQGAVTATPRAVDLLAQTQPWVRFISVMTFIAAGFMIVAGLIMVAVGAAGGGRSEPTFLGCIYIPMALLYVFPAVFLWRYASGIQTLRQSLQPGALEQALEAQKSFWKFVGIMMIIVLAIYAVLLLVVLAVGVTGFRF